MFWIFGHEACGILAPQPGVKPTPPALEGEVVITGQTEKGPPVFFWHCSSLHVAYLWWLVCCHLCQYTPGCFCTFFPQTSNQSLLHTALTFSGKWCFLTTVWTLGILSATQRVMVPRSFQWLELIDTDRMIDQIPFKVVLLFSIKFQDYRFYI